MLGEGLGMLTPRPSPSRISKRWVVEKQPPPTEGS